MDFEWDCVVVGGGAAGLSAALPLGRARRRTLLLDGGGQSNRTVEHVGGLLGQEGVSPAELYHSAREQLAGYDAVEIRDAEAVDARSEDGGFALVLGRGDELTTRAIVLATGMDYEVPSLPGFAEHWGRAVFHCPFCHGWEVRDRPLVVCSDASVAEHQAELLRAWTDDVTVVDPADVAGLRSDGDEVQAVVRRDGSEVPCEAVLVHAPMRPRAGLAERLGLELTEKGVAVDPGGRTSMPGVYAAGDVAGAVPQVAVAIGSGHAAGVTAARELLLGR